MFSSISYALVDFHRGLCYRFDVSMVFWWSLGLVTLVEG